MKLKTNEVFVLEMILHLYMYIRTNACVIYVIDLKQYINTVQVHCFIFEKVVYKQTFKT